MESSLKLQVQVNEGNKIFQGKTLLLVLLCLNVAPCLLSAVRHTAEVKSRSPSSFLLKCDLPKI